MGNQPMKKFDKCRGCECRRFLNQKGLCKHCTRKGVY